jgi:LacI family transcriptional regulator
MSWPSPLTLGRKVLSGLVSARRVTIVDVAAHAGVHAGTVSRALTQPDRVAPQTRERIEIAVRELGFVPSRAARGLITGRTGIAAVIVPDITNPHFGSLVRGVEKAARLADLQVLLVDTGEHPDEEVEAARTLAHDVDVFVALSPRLLHRRLEALGSKPAVFVNRPVRGHSCVLLRSAPAVAEGMRHLASMGHSRVTYLCGPSGSWAAGERRTAVRRTGGETGLAVHELAVSTPTFDAAAESIDSILAARTTAVMAFNDQMALGVIAGLTERGVSVPGEISVVGCDDVPLAVMVAPALTTIAMPADAAGAAAVALFQGEAARADLYGSLVVRRSTGPVNARSASGA